MMVWDFIQNQILGMKWLNAAIGSVLSALGLDTGSRWGGSIQFFLYDVIKITVLLCLLIFVISYIQSYFPPERSKRILGRFHGLWANLIAALLGTVTIEQIYPQDLAQTDYVIIPQILHWEDRATGWSFVPDRIEVRFDIYNNQRQLIDSYLINGRSAYIVWVSKQPNSLLPKPIRAMLKELFGKLK